MAVYNNIALSGDGALGEALTIPGAPYTFTFTNTNTANPPTGDGTDPFNTNDCYFIMNSNRATYEGSEFTGTGTNVGALKGGLIPLSNTVGSITGGPYTFIFDVQGDQQGSGAQIALTSTAGTITRANVIRGGRFFTSGDGITISQNDLQAAGFSNADASQQLDLFPDHIEGNYISSNFAGTYANFTTDVSQSNFVSSSCGFSFGIKQSIGNGAGTFDFTPTTTIPVNSYLIKSTGHITLNISPA